MAVITWLSLPQKGNERFLSVITIMWVRTENLKHNQMTYGMFVFIPLNLYVSILSRWRMYITLVTDILVHYYMGKIQEVIFFKICNWKGKKEKFLGLCLYIYLCKYAKYIYKHKPKNFSFFPFQLQILKSITSWIFPI